MKKEFDKEERDALVRRLNGYKGQVTMLQNRIGELTKKNADLRVYRAEYDYIRSLPWYKRMWYALAKM